MLEKEIKEWRRQMLAGGVKEPGVLDELENHLRQSVARPRVEMDGTESRPFNVAVSRMGQAGPLRAEFSKVLVPGCVLGRQSLVVDCGDVCNFFLFACRMAFTKQHGALLVAHILTLTAGYCAFVAGSFAICHICCRTFHQLTPERRQSFANLRFSLR